MANEVTVTNIPGASLAIVGKQFLRTAFHQAFERVGGVDAIVDVVNPEVPIYQRDVDGKFKLDEQGEKIIIGTERKRNNEAFLTLLSLMVRLEPKEVNVRDDRGIEETVDAIEAQILGPAGDD